MTQIVVEDDLLGNPFGEDIFVISIDGQWAMLDHTGGEGPIEVGFSHGDLSTTEIAECLVAELTDPDDIIQKERSRRPVRRAGTFHGLQAVETLNDGKPIRTQMKISIGNGHDVGIWAANRDAATLTTGTVIVCDGTLYGRWQR